MGKLREYRARKRRNLTNLETEAIRRDIERGNANVRLCSGKEIPLRSYSDRRRQG